MLLMSFLNVRITAISQKIHTFNNQNTAKDCFAVHIGNCLIILAFNCWLSSSISQEYYYIIKVMNLDCEKIAISTTSYRNKLIRSQLSTNRFMLPKPSDSGPSYTPQIHNSLTIPSNNRSLDMTILYCSERYSTLELNCFAKYWMESTLRNFKYPNHRSYLPRPSMWGRNQGCFF
jgi:hypothetical protein